MSEHRPGEGGSANTPPFPRLVPDESPEPEAAAAADRIRIVAADSARPELREPPLDARSDDSTPRLTVENGEPAGIEDEEGDLGDLVAGAADQVRRAGRSMNRGFQNVANQLEDLADRLESVAGLGESRGAAGLARVARKTSSVLGDSATYLRITDVQEMRGDLESRVRTQPLKTLLAVTAAGWIVGKIVR